MSESPHEQVTRGAAEETSGTPLTETEIATSQRPASQPPDQAAGDGAGGAPDAAADILGSGPQDRRGIDPLEERPEVVAAIEDDTTVPGLGDSTG